MYEPGTTVRIAYTGYSVEAKVLNADHVRGWYVVEQITDFEDAPEGERPVYQAAEEFMSLPDEPPKLGPFEVLWKRLER